MGFAFNPARVNSLLAIAREVKRGAARGSLLFRDPEMNEGNQGHAIREIGHHNTNSSKRGGG